MDWLRPGKHVCNYIVLAFHMFNSEVISGELVFESQQLRIRRNLIAELEDVGKR